MASAKVILLSGIPGSGKSSFAQWLHSHGWITVETDRLVPGASPSNEAEAAWMTYLIGDPERLRALIAAEASQIVVEWGFPVNLLFHVLFQMQLGMEGWWFDGDHAACLTSWRQAHPGADVSVWQQQEASIQAVWPAIAAAFGNRIVRVVGPGPWRLPHEQIASLMGLAVEREGQ